MRVRVSLCPCTVEGKEKEICVYVCVQRCKEAAGLLAVLQSITVDFYARQTKLRKKLREKKMKHISTTEPTSLDSFVLSSPPVPPFLFYFSMSVTEFFSKSQPLMGDFDERAYAQQFGKEGEEESKEKQEY